jgi:Tol biopolymer transport system component
MAGRAEGKIVFNSSRAGSHDIWIMDDDGNNKVQLTFSPDVEVLPVFSPDGSKIAYINFTTKQLMIMDIDDTNQVPIYTSNARQIAYPYWSRTGDRLTGKE